MYCEFYGFKESPFTITPNSRFIFFSKNHREAFAHLFYGVTNRAGFIELTGEVGAGKTTVIRTLLNQLDDDHYRTALILNPCLSGLELMRSINREFGVPSEELNSSELLQELNRFLLTENAAGHTVVLVIDEAQNLAPQVLEQIRLISNLETETAKLIQIVLAGQPELGTLLERTDLRQLSQRISVRYHLRPMDFADTRAYIEHRLEIVEGRFAVRFTPSALKKIYRFSGGLPRLINIVCDRSLLVAFGDAQREISSGTVATAISEIRRERMGSRPMRGFRPALLVIALCCLASAFYLFNKFRTGAGVPLPTAGVPGGGTNPSALASTSPRWSDPSRTTEVENCRQAFAVLARLWGAPAPAAPPDRAGEQGLRRMSRQAGLQCDSLRTNLTSLRRLDVPVMLEVKLPGVKGKRYLAVTGMTAKGVVVAPPLRGNATLSPEKLRSIWGGRCYVVWRNYRDIPFILSHSAAGREVTSVRRMLEKNGFSTTGRNTAGSGSLAASLAAFQRSRGILPDGKLGVQTLLLLYRDGSDFTVPRLEKGREGHS
ncbi:AAA family ATPase [bacterium]|nr:AAA family ATPase [bacterium]